MKAILSVTDVTANDGGSRISLAHCGNTGPTVLGGSQADVTL
jgi:hypothetical protein